MSPSTPSLSSTAQAIEQIREQLHTLQQQLPALLAPHDNLTPDAATHYNDAMYHLQSVREELRLLSNALPTSELPNEK